MDETNHAVTTPFCLILCALPDNALVTHIAQQILESNLAACISILPTMRSLYRWQGKIADTPETLILIKTRHDLFPAIKVFIKKQHPYECPEIISLPITQGTKEYFEWIQNCTSKNI